MVRMNMTEEAGERGLVSGLLSEVINSDLGELCGCEHGRCHKGHKEG